MLSEIKFKEVAELFSAFTFGVMQGFDQIVDMANDHGIDVADVQDYVKESVNNIKGPHRINKKLRDGSIIIKKCDECGAEMKLESVNDSPRTQIPGGWKSVFSCLRESACGHQIFNRDAPGLVVQKILKKRGIIDDHGITGRDVHGIRK